MNRWVPTWRVMVPEVLAPSTEGRIQTNLFYLDLARLSVDIDLNYIAHVDREKMLAERPDVVRAVKQIAAGLGYRAQKCR